MQFAIAFGHSRIGAGMRRLVNGITRGYPALAAPSAVLADSIRALGSAPPSWGKRNPTAMSVVLRDDAAVHRSTNSRTQADRP